MSGAEEFERCRRLAFDAARLAHDGQPGEPRRFRFDTPDGGWVISAVEPWLQRLEVVQDRVTAARTVRAHVPEPGRTGPSGWDDARAAQFEDCLRRFVAERDLPMMLRFDVQLVVRVTAVADGSADLRRRIHRVTELVTRTLAVVDGGVTIEIFPADTFTQNITRV